MLTENVNKKVKSIKIWILLTNMSDKNLIIFCKFQQTQEKFFLASLQKYKN